MLYVPEVHSTTLVNKIKVFNFIIEQLHEHIRDQYNKDSTVLHTYIVHFPL